MFENYISKAIEKNQDSSGILVSHRKQQFNQAALNFSTSYTINFLSQTMDHKF